MDKTIVILDDNGSALGAVHMKNEEDVILTDNSGKQIQQVSIKITIKEVKEILLRRKIKYIS